MSQQHPHHHYHHSHHIHHQQQQQQQQHQEHFALQQNQQKLQHKQIQHNWYSHVASYPHAHPPPPPPPSSSSHTAAFSAPCKGNINMSAYSTPASSHTYYGGAGVGGGGMGVNVNAGNSTAMGYTLDANASNTVAYAHNQLLQYQQQHQQQQNQRAYMSHGHNLMHGPPTYPYIKREPIELPDKRQRQQQPQQQQQHFQSPNPMAPPPAPTTRPDAGNDMIIKSEPVDEHAYKSNYIDDNMPFADFSKFPEFNQDMLSPKVELTVKEESYGNASQKHPLNFPRRKMQTERADSLPICQRCKEVFFKKQNYIRHVADSNCSIHEYDFKCSICPMSFMSAEELQKHKQLHQADKFFCHKYCGKHYDTIAECESHEYMHHEYDSFVCNMCSGNFATREQLYAHLPQHKFQPRYDCPICRLWYQTAVELHEHRLAAPYFCGKYYTATALNSGATQTSAAQQQANYKLQDCHMTAALDMPNASPQKTAAATLPATAALSSLLQQRQANADGGSSGNGSGLYSSLKTDVKLERSYSNSTSDSSYSLHDSGYNNNAYGSDSSLHGSCSGSQVQSAHSSTLDDSDDALCCVPMCGVRKSTSPTLQFFTFPKDEKYLHQWLHNLKMFHIPAATYAGYRICSMHFPKRCINRYSLCYWAVPTFNLGHDDVANLYQNRELTNTFTVGEVARCSMPSCNSQRGESNLKFYNFPKDIKSLIKWCQNARLPVQAKEPRHFCSRHFEERCIGKFRLKPWAVPTLHLGTQYGKIHDNPKNLYVEEKRCCLPFCRRSRSSDFNMSLYRFPRDEVLLRRWCYNLRLDPGVYRGKNHKICSAHFIKEALGLRKLSPGAVPTLHLGHGDTFNIYENELWPPPTPAVASSHNQQSKSYHRQSAASTSSSASSASFYMESEPSSSYMSMGAGNGSSSSLNVTECMDVCCVPGCESKRHNNEEITFHTIPRRPEQMRKWCHNIKIPEEKMHKGMRICSIHFESYCIGGCMRPFAVPTLHLGHDDDNIYRNPEVIKKLNIRETCCVQVCKRNRDRDHANLHRFPSNMALLTKWCANLRRPVPDGNKLFNDAICEVHFEDRCLRNKRLEKWAVPTLVLGHDDIPYQLPTESEVAEFYLRPSAPNNGDEEGECCVETCKRNPNVDDIKLYRPPEMPEVLTKWAHNLQVDVDQLQNLRICNLHFESHCIGKRMRPWAIPTLNLASNIENLYENPDHTMLYARKQRLPHSNETPISKPTWVPRCCLPHCRKVRAIHNVQLYRFPKANRATLAKWAHNLQVPIIGSAQRRVCSAHFEPHVLSKKCPIPLAVPTLDLNTPTDYKIYQNPAKLKASKLCLQRVCIIESCRRQRSHGVQLFRFPHRHTQFRKWMHNIKQRATGAARAQYRICSMHFESHSFHGRKLSAGAIPTLELGHDDDDIYPNEVQSFVEEHCAVEGCNSSKEQPDVRLFKYPTDDEDLLWKWCNNLKMNPVDCAGVRICNKHFESDCIGPKHLFKWAIPTLALGHDDDEIELVPNPKPEERYVDPIFKCCVPTCGKTRKFDEVQMNSFPKDAELFQRWRHNLRLDHLSFKERDRYKICNAHFEDICIGKTRLNIGAIPTLELGHDEKDDLYTVNPEELQSNLFGRQRRIRELLSAKGVKQESDEVTPDDTMEEATDFNTTQVKIKRSLTELKCCIKSCGKSRLEDGARLFAFPTGKQQLSKWRHNLGLGPNEVDKTSRICSVHFNKRCFDGKQLRGWAIPTLHLGHSEEQPIYENPKNLPSFFTPTCALPHCRKRRSIDNDFRTYRYPQQEELLEKWCANLRMEPPQCRGRICADHFEPEVRGKQKLRTGAVPTLNLGHDLDVVYNNEAIKLSLKALDEQDALDTSTETTSDQISLIQPKSEPTDDGDEEPLDNEYFDPLELVETYADQQSDDNDDEDEEMEPEPEPEEVLPDTPPPRREKPANNVTPICCLRHCRKERTAQHHLSTFGFPKNEELLEKWCANLQLQPDECVGRVCVEHFDPEVLGTRKLKQNAVPTINVGHDEPLQYAHTGEELPQQQMHRHRETNHAYNQQPQHSVFRLSSLKHCRKRKLSEPPDITDDRHQPKSTDCCCVAKCGNTSDGVRVRLHRFPKERAVLRKWLHNLQLAPSANTTTPKICSEHFEPQCFRNGILLPFAVPTIKLGHCDHRIYRNKSVSNATRISAVKTSTIDSNAACLVPNCHRVRRHYALPAHKDVRDAWLQYLQLPADTAAAQHLCAMHFMELYEEARLPDSLPSGIREQVKQAYEFIASTPTAQMSRCAVPGCHSKSTQNIRFSKLPQSKEMCAKWLHNTNMKYDPSRHYNYRICILHFEPESLGLRRPKSWAVPTLQLGHNDVIFLNRKPNRKPGPACLTPMFPLSIKTERLDELVTAVKLSPSPRGLPKMCCIPMCGHLSGHHITLYRFPTAELMLQKWIVNTRQRITEASRLYVCETHFEPEAFCKKELRCWALPTLLLGHNDYVIQNAKHNGDIVDGQQDQEVLQYIRKNYCSVVSCFQRGGEQLRLFAYPTDRPTIRKWATNCKHRSMQASSNSFQVCQLHFATDCFDDAGELREGAVPTLQLNQSPSTLLQSAWSEHNARSKTPLQPKQETEQHCQRYSDTKSIIKNSDSVCCVPGCGKSKLTHNVVMSKFPKLRVLADKWQHNLQMTSVKDLSDQKVCSSHFEPNCFCNGNIRTGAIPTLNLGHDKQLADIYQTKEQTLGKSRKHHIYYYKFEGHTCCHPECKDIDKFLRIAFDLPRKQALRAAWCKHMKVSQPNATKEDELKLCALHFFILYEHSAEHFEEHKTCTDADELAKLAESYATARTFSRVRKSLCSVPKCSTFQPRDGLRLHSLPKRQDLLDMWLHNTQLEMNEAQLYLIKVCEKHFEPSCFTELKRFKQWSVPTLHLPEPAENSKLYKNPTETEWDEMNQKLALDACKAVELAAWPDSSRDVEVSDESNLSSWQEQCRSETEDNSLLEPIVVMEHNASDEENDAASSMRVSPSEDTSSQPQPQPQEMEALEVLLEVGHVEKCTSYELIDPGPSESSLGASSYHHGYHNYHSGMQTTYNARHCCISGCDITIHDTEVKLHKFPSSLDALQKWMHNSQVEVDTKFSWRYRICSYHFEPECFNGYRFRSGTVPTLHLGPNRPQDIYENEFDKVSAPTPPVTATKRPKPSQEEDEQPLQEQSYYYESDSELIIPTVEQPRKKSSKTCQIIGCDNHLTSNGITLHKFPHSPELCYKWQHNTQVPFNPKFRWRYRICSAHFHPFCLLSTRLLHGSVPTLNLGPNAPPDLYDNSFQTINMQFDKQTNTEQQGDWIEAEGDFDEDEEQHNMLGNDDDDEDDDMRLLVPELQLEVTEDNELNFTNNGLDSESEHYDNSFNWNFDKPQSQSQSHSQSQSPRPSSNKKEQSTSKIVYNEIKSGYDKCSLVHCQKQRSQHGVHIYKFPRSRQQQDRWMYNLRIQFDERRPWKYLVCSDHFEPRCIRLRKLQRWAVPTLRLGSNVPQDIYTNDHSTEWDEPNDVSDGSDDMLSDDETAPKAVARKLPVVPPSWRMTVGPETKTPPWKIKACCLPHCRSPRGDGIKLFRLPNSSSAIRTWEQSTGMAFKESQRNTKLICSRHFEPELIGVRRLSRGAIPTLHLGPAGKKLTLLPEAAPPQPTRAAPPAKPTIIKLPPAPSCCITDCRGDANAKLLKFPNDDGLLRKWCRALKLDDVQQYRGKYICAAHLSFKSPSCIVCAGDDIKLPLQNFPENRNLRAKWCYNLKIQLMAKCDSGHHYICSKHFERYCFAQSGQLLPDATPTLHLKHTDKNIFLNDHTLKAGDSRRLPLKPEPKD